MAKPVVRRRAWGVLVGRDARETRRNGRRALMLRCERVADVVRYMAGLSMLQLYIRLVSRIRVG